MPFDPNVNRLQKDFGLKRITSATFWTILYDFSMKKFIKF